MAPSPKCTIKSASPVRATRGQRRFLDCPWYVEVSLYLTWQDKSPLKPAIGKLKSVEIAAPQLGAAGSHSVPARIQRTWILKKVFTLP